MNELGYFLNIDKPPGITSRDVVNRVVKIVGSKRVGHAGTLDPLATGVLVVAVNRATRLVEYVQQQGKVYSADFRLGQTSDTDDIEGNIQDQVVETAPTRTQVEEALRRQVGEIEQLPPTFSALKIKGKAAYQLARQGVEVHLAPRTVRVDSIDLLSYEYPRLSVQIACGSGTYIRSIARDVGRELGTGGLMSRLRRTQIGLFRADQASPIDQIAQAERHPLAAAMLGWPHWQVDRENERRFHQGKTFSLLDRPENVEPMGTKSQGAVFNIDGDFIGIAERLSPDSLACKPIKGGFSPFASQLADG
jgi:tRNA pseudouridine55 synthase